VVKSANLHRLKYLERRIGRHSLEHEANVHQKLLENLESAIRQIAKMNGEDPEAAVEAHRAKQGGTIREQVEAYIEGLRQGGENAHGTPKAGALSELVRIADKN
jgi:hypothetical protein